MTSTSPRKATSRFIYFLEILKLFLILFSGGVPCLRAQELPRAEVSKPVKSDISRRLSEVPIIKPFAVGPPHEHAVKRLPPLAPKLRLQEDSAVQTLLGKSITLQVGGFEGLGVGNYGVNAAPPDTNGSPGTSQYVEWVNEAFAIFDKKTGKLIYGPADGRTLWVGFGGECESTNDGDPIVLYDKDEQRWLMTQFAVSKGPPYYQCIAVSTTGDATGPYARYAYKFRDFNDYPKFGIWPDAYYASFNMFRNGQQFIGGKACAFEREKMLVGAHDARMVCFDLSVGGLLPSDLDGRTKPPARSPNFFLNFGVNRLNLWKFQVDWNHPQASTFRGPLAITVAPFNEACGDGGSCIPQPNTSQLLESLGDRLLYRLAYRNNGQYESLVVSHNVLVRKSSGTSSTGIRWYELRNPSGAPTVHQQSTYAPDTTARWMGSMAADRSGNMLLGYTASSSKLHPSIRVAGRLTSDPPNALSMETDLQPGHGSQINPLARWGDYSSMSIDPIDDCTFWYTTEYLKTTGKWNWNTYIAQVKFPGCGTVPVNQDNSAPNDSAPQAVIQGQAPRDPSPRCVAECQRQLKDSIDVCDYLFEKQGSPYYHNTAWHKECLANAKTEFDNCLSLCSDATQIEDLRFALCYRCSLDRKLCYSASARSGRTECDDSSGKCMLSGEECGLGAYRETISTWRGSRLSLHKTLTTEGKVLDHNGSPCGDVIVQLFLPNGLLLETMTNKDGDFVFRLGDYATQEATNPQIVHLPSSRIEDAEHDKFVRVFAYPK